ncbi:mitochondrial monothiol glutaredoxin-5-like protein [Calocera cornea HHB12733]|uniref:Mitochondrial monothiol glutaredoxin-5-like protein n=1 Tax=Calocera cornea HHB12733 TaxID=1353952 RepID=A0A165EIR1_9BASI|nr:mitochondrial monothiol glutaredoxin-5-like protein [Calocera cornea HHB12733]
MSFRTAARIAFAPRRTLASTFLSNPSFCRRFLSVEHRKAIDDAVHKYPLVLFMKGTPDQPQCGFSRAVCQILDVQGVPQNKIKSFNVLEDEELRNGIKEYSPYDREWPTIPQLYVNGEFVGGCDIVLSSEHFHSTQNGDRGDTDTVHQNGELEELLAKNGLAPPLPEQATEQAK